MEAKGNFVNDDGRYKTEKPYIYHGPDLGFPSTNLILKEGPLKSLTDLRTLPDFKPTMESQGFCFIENKSKELPALTDESNSKPYAIEMAGALEKLLGATKVIPVHVAVSFLYLSYHSCFSFSHS